MTSNVVNRILTIAVLSIFFFSGGIVGIHLKNQKTTVKLLTLERQLLVNEQRHLTDRITLLTSCAEGNIIKIEDLNFMCMPLYPKTLPNKQLPEQEEYML